MNATQKKGISRDLLLNVLSTGLVGVGFGLLYAYGFEFSLILGGLAGAAFGAAVGFRITHKPPRMRYPAFMLRRILLAAALLVFASLVYSCMLDQGLSQVQRY